METVGTRRPDLVLADLHKSYGGVHALDGASLACWRGEVHGFVGENGAGKSTLVKILSGAVSKDSGEIALGGERIEFRSPAGARRAGIGTVFQELSLIPHLSVAQNLFYGNEPGVRAGRIRPRALRSAARDVLARFGFEDIDPGRPAAELRLAERQVLEIVKVLIREPEVLVLDEPTSALLPEQVDWLFATVRSFATAGGIVIFISHRLAEIERLCDRVTVLRGGRDVGHGPIADMSEAYLVELMLGRKIDRFYPQAERSERIRAGEVLCRLEGFGSPPRLHDIDLELEKGQILGVGGLEGQGQADLFRALFGVQASTGRFDLNGQPVRVHSPRDALNRGIGLVPEDRASGGLCLSLSVRDNISLGSLDDVSRLTLISRRREQDLLGSAVERLSITLRHPSQEVGALSGGNQQKVLLGRVLAARPSLLLLYDATRGVDVGTKTEIYHLMHELCRDGVGILFYSTEASELANMADEVLVLHDGTVRARLSGDELTEERIVAAAVGGRAAA